ncbi:fatty acid desaturase (delta-4 desaturase) [Apostasia shenzhenica]|uniref:Fatty acid desaturase (Delta-4 desaturase) n=1 Tax=Apostasia shenzhenica TaxID=1088818 RepID=A0A2H9ZRX1_9ASPA|nr:fatty acid desaturase (delta-4 desaturase) [Apostasia shenzhenica]
MEDVVTEIPPPSRFFQEDLNNFADPDPRLPSPFLCLNANPNLLRPSLLMISISAPSISILHHIPQKVLIGTLILPEIPLSGNPLEPSPRDKSCNIYSIECPPSGAILVAVQYVVSPERSRAVAKALLGQIQAEKIVVFDSIRGENYRGRLSVDEALAFKLETLEQRRSRDPVLRDLQYFPSGSVMAGLGAALLGECQMRRTRATLCATWPESGRPSVVPLLLSLLKGMGLEVGKAESVTDDDVRVSSPFVSDLYT